MMYHVNDNKVSMSVVNVSYWVLFMHCVLSEFFQPYSSHLFWQYLTLACFLNPKLFFLNTKTV